jgi:prepilin-type N-terminal cleavage/methylation domain-containing protein
VPRQPSTHARLNDGELELDLSDRHHEGDMIRSRFGARVAGERGFTLIELLVVMILIAILAAIALAVFLRQEDKGRDAATKSDVTNLVHEVQDCNSGRDSSDDFRDCDTTVKLGQTGLAVSADGPSEISSGDCSDPAPLVTVNAPGVVRVVEAGQDCFVVLGLSNSGNRFWYVKHNGGLGTRDCTTHGVNGCPRNGAWAG